MTKGIVTLATNEDEFNAASLLAYSLKISNPNLPISLITDFKDKVPHHQIDIYNSIEELPYSKSEITRQNDWQLYWASPYDETIFIDCYTLVKCSIEQIFEYYSDHYDIIFPRKILDFKGNVLKNKHISQLIDNEYKIEYVNSDFFYFKKNSQIALEYFKLSDHYMQNWNAIYSNTFAKHHKPLTYSSDITHGLLCFLYKEETTGIHEVAQCINMQTTLDDGIIGKNIKHWQDRLDIWFSYGTKLKLQNFAINKVFHHKSKRIYTFEIENDHKVYYDRIRK